MAATQTMHPIPPPQDSSSNLNTPTAPRMHAVNQPQAPPQFGLKEEDISKTPTTATFAEANGKRALPLSPPPPAHATIAKHVVPDNYNEDSKRPVSRRSNNSMDSGDMHGTDASHPSPENDGSDDESIDGDTNRPTKKKKGQRFFCTDYPPCNLSFTRSEHLARHIRKHTGERPFQCHCNRRFSRLDNLRQHAQTVHVNEEIPTDSLAATGTRFQRQIRTDRVRPAGARPRASTTGATGHVRGGHGRNLSTSSIASTASTMSTMSTISTMSQDHRFHPVVIAPDQRPPPGLSIDTQRASSQYSYPPSASGGPTTPTSTNYSGAPPSPYSVIASPAASSRYPSYDGGNRHSHARRLSVPNGPSSYPQGYSQAPMSPSSQSFIISSNNSTIASPTTSVFSARTELTPSEADLRRRTWHPSTYGFSYPRPATSGLSYSQTPDAPQPAFAPQAAAAASQPVTLPGFRDLLNTVNRPSTPPGQVNQPPPDKSPGRPPFLTAGSSSDHSSVAGDRRSWDASLPQTLNRLDIASGTPPRDVGWGQQTISDINHAAASVQGPVIHQQIQPPNQHPSQAQQAQQPPLLGPPLQPPHAQATQPMEIEPSSPNRNRRPGWYTGHAAPALHMTQQQQQQQQQRISPASSISEGVPTPSNPTFEHHPSIVHANGYVEAPRVHLQTAPPAPQSGYNSIPAQKPADQAPLSGLDALVAAATSESHNRDEHR